MKTIVIAAVTAAVAAVAAPAFAQTMHAPQVYAGIGYTNVAPDGHDLGEITGRLGAKFNPYFGVEGEFGSGINNGNYTTGANNRVSLSEQPTGAGYLVGFIPITHKFEFLIRMGYGYNEFKYERPTGTNEVVTGSINTGVGAQYSVTDKDAIRIDYTRRDFQSSAAPRDTDTFGASYVRKF
jgi:outer membrane immunogenic protein